MMQVYGRNGKQDSWTGVKVAAQLTFFFLFRVNYFEKDIFA